MKKGKILLMAVLALLAIIIVFQNTEAVDTKLLFITVTMPRALLLIVVLLVGFILGLIAPISLYGKKDQAGSGRA